MTLRELILSVDPEQYSDLALYQELRATKPEYGLNIQKEQLLDAILRELSSEGFSDSDESAFWDDFDNLQKAKIIR